jgi:hypothetical protein
MNDRIDKLIEQCTRQNFSDCVGGFETFDKEKFAELIVKECADIVDNKIGVSRYVHEAELLRECSTTIKQHFGVEE